MNRLKEYLRWPSPQETLNLYTPQTCDLPVSFDHSDNATYSPLLRPDKRRDSTLTLFANSGFPSLSIRFFWWDSNPRTLNIFRPPLNRGLHCLALYRLSYRRLIPCGTDSMIFIRSAKTLVFSSAGFEPARSESKSEKVIKCRALS